ncbi:venom dipeptidyl peptidase 4-like [Aphidius gifuensis]|nr:venom dipeptidyl peptidase 4-like [Aphidius gifuensis]
MAFGYFNDTMTNIIDIPFYGTLNSNLSYQYPQSYNIYYPKAGRKNPIVKLFYIDLEIVDKSNAYNKSFYEILPPLELLKSEIILAAVVFPNETSVSVTWMNRIQNESYIQLCNVNEFHSTTVFKYAEKEGWLSPGSPPKYNKDASKFLMILPQKQFDNDYWYHLAIVSINTTNNYPAIRYLTSGTFVVTKIVGWDEKKSLVYYLATVDNQPDQLHFYRVSTLNNYSKSECLSCNVSSLNKRIPCRYNNAILSPSNSRYILTCFGPDVPDVSIYNSSNLIKLLTWEDNSKLINLLKNKKMPQIKRLRVPVPGGFNAEVQLFIPSNADLSGTKKYPLLVDVYAGPDSNKITDKFKIHWGTYLVTNKNFIYAFIDGRGSNLKGNSMLFSVYKNLGNFEILDQINVTRYLQNNYAFIDKNKTSIWGWSYGGYAAGMSLALDHGNVFKCGISVAPVTSWYLYDSIYTERYMGLPNEHDNKYGYDNGELIKHAKNIKSNSYYLVHGTFDDNVHYQHSLLLAKELEKSDILFRQQTYTDESHGIDGLLPHLYHSLENFLDECLIK